MLKNHTVSNIFPEKLSWLARALSGCTAAALFLACSTFVDAQTSPLTVQPSTGRVGVGTTLPQAKIEARGTDVGISVMNNAGNQNYYFGINDSDGSKLYIGKGRDPSQGFAPAITILQSDNVGIGTTNPLARLEAKGEDVGLSVMNNAGNQNYYFGIKDSDGSKLYIGKGKDPSQGFAPAITIVPSDNVGIGTTSPEFLLHVNGSAGKPGGGSWATASDARLKTNIQDLDGTLDKLLRLRGVGFDYKDPKAITELSGNQIGMIAQEVEQVFPQWVDEGTDGYKRVTYRGFEALTVEALRQLRDEKNNQIASLRETVERQQSQIETLREEMDRLLGKLRLADSTLIAR